MVEPVDKDPVPEGAALPAKDTAFYKTCYKYVRTHAHYCNEIDHSVVITHHYVRMLINNFNNY